MATGGFFTRIEARQARGRMKRVERADDLPLDYLHKMGPKGVRSMNPSAKNPEMKPYGDARPDVYVLGDVPNAEDDLLGRPFSSKEATCLRAGLPPELPVVFDNIVRTTTPKGRAPKPVEVECFRPVVEESIAAAKPKVIIACGATVLKWFFPTIKTGIKGARGRRFVVTVGGHTCYMYPILSPAFISFLKPGERTDEIQTEEWIRTFAWDLSRVGEIARLRKPLARAADEQSLMKGVTIARDAKAALNALQRLSKADRLAFDIETKNLRPYAPGSKVLTVAISSGEETVAFPIDHPMSQIRGADRKAVLEAFRDLIATGPPLTAHNLPFELEWMIFLFGVGIARANLWNCTQAQAFILGGAAKGTQSLDFCTMQRLGFSLKSLTPGLDKNNLDRESMEKVLRYNALDAKYTYYVEEEQAREIEAQGLQTAYDIQITRVPSMVLAQRAGISVDVAKVETYRVQYEKRIAELEAQARALPVVKQYIQQYKVFSLGSSDACIRIFRDFLERPEGKRGSSYSADAPVLEAMAKKGVVLAQILQEHRSISKLKGTYIDKFAPDHPETYLYPDGRVHCNFNTTFTETGRTSSDNPNNQNWPKRHDKHIRSIIVPGEGWYKLDPGDYWILLASDYGQIEARVLGMASKDQKFCEALRTGYDVHMEWAEKIADAFPKALAEVGAKGMKDYRSIIKNGWVFPLFYGAGWKSCARNLKLPEGTAQGMYKQFWVDFNGVQRWQRRVTGQYEKHHYVETLTGRRRRGPMNHNMIINTPIQGTASDIVVNAMNRCSEYAYDQDVPWMQPVLNIHDDLSFIVPKSQQDRAVETISGIMLDVPFDFVNVPITIEMEVGEKNWYEMKSVGVFQSDRKAA